MRSLTLKTPWHFVSLLGLLVACSEANDSDAGNDQEDGAASGGASVGGQEALAAGGAVSPVTTGGTGGDQITATSGGAASGGTSSGGSSSASGGSSGGSESMSTGGTTSEGAGGSPVDASGGAPALEELAADLHELFIHDACTGVQAQDDTCTHPQLIEETFTFGGDPSTTYLLVLRVRGLFEPTNIAGGEAPVVGHPYFIKGGTVQAADYSRWQIEVKEPAEIYTLNHYPQTSHTIYQEDFEAPIEISGGSEIVVRVTDANDRQIDNATTGLPDRQQVIEGVTEEYLDGQMLRLDVVSVEIQN